MLVSGPASCKINFGRALSQSEMVEYKQVLESAKKESGANGKSILIVHDACLPQSDLLNTGVGNLSSKDAMSFFDFAKSYLGINTVEVLPQGQVEPVFDSRFYCAYNASALSLGNHQISLELLTSPEYGNILKNEEFSEVVKFNQLTERKNIVNFENVMDNNSPQDMALRKAFHRFNKSNFLKDEFSSYISKNNDWLLPKGIYKILSDAYGSTNYKNWPNELDKNLYNPDFSLEKRQDRIKALLQDSKNKEEVEFFQFKQFMADRHLKNARAKLNQKGLKLFGDCLIGFAKDEVWANPNAFVKNATVGWGLPVLDFNTILDENSESAKLLKRKVGLFASRYDGIRFDVGWSYVVPKIKYHHGEEKRLDYGGKVLDFIEKSVKAVKGADYQKDDLIYEFEAGYEDFSPFKHDKLRSELKNRLSVFSEAYMSDDWGSTSAFKKRGWTKDELVLGVANHDPIPLRQLAEESDPLDRIPAHEIKAQKARQIRPLAKILHLDEKKLIDDFKEFMRAKFAEPLMGKNTMVFYMDVFGRQERFDSQYKNSGINYRYKIPDTFESDYHKTIQEGMGFNIMDAFEKVFRAKKLDESNPSLFKKILKFKAILLEKEPEILQFAIKAKPKTSKVKVFALASAGLAGVSSGILALRFWKNGTNSNLKSG